MVAAGALAFSIGWFLLASALLGVPGFRDITT
jgi:hypothetical protein